MSIVCSSFNFTSHWDIWPTLHAAAARPVSGTVYLDAHAGSPAAVAAHPPRAIVFGTLTLPGAHQPLVSHAKFIINDRALTLLTSANFSLQRRKQALRSHGGSADPSSGGPHRHRYRRGDLEPGRAHHLAAGNSSQFGSQPASHQRPTKASFSHFSLHQMSYPDDSTPLTWQPPTAGRALPVTAGRTT
jgi:hypothetical protein